MKEEEPMEPLPDPIIARPPAGGKKGGGKDDKGSPKKKEPAKDADGKGRIVSQTQSTSPAVKRNSENLQKAIILQVENEVGVTAKGEVLIEATAVEKKADKAVVLWKSKDFSQPELFEQVSQDKDKSGDLLKRMDVDLKLGGVRLFIDEEGEKCAIPTDSDIELMRAEEEDDSEQLDLESEAELQNREDKFQKVRHKKNQVSLVKRQSSRVKDKEVVYKAISLMQRWKVLLSKERDREALIVLLEKLKAKLESLRPVDVLPDNISV
ncbi:hypothetical protein OsI_33585 [Oryza sativa Indica Group]|uniref:Uncharacterized protein n=1 Tax=Oryza sativa subsp. indica TaxID=39946 RepID=A2Z7A9_ORYSI|nr:hypothetical protein OsI_33585 [Oryza sativa Indica Group]